MTKKHPPSKHAKKKVKSPAKSTKKKSRSPTLEKLSGVTALAVASNSNPTQSAWSSSRSVVLNWTFPPNQDVKGVYYVVDHYGDTVPTASATFIPAKQQQLIKTLRTAGIWVFHFVWADKQGRMANAVAHYQVRIGNDPGVGNLVGRIYDKVNMPISGAALSINRGLFPVINSQVDGSFASPAIPIGEWQVTASRAGYKSVTKRLVVVSAATPAIFALTPLKGRAA